MNGHGFVLVPLDGSKNAENALPVAVELAGATGLPLRVIHVLEEQPRARSDAVARARQLFEQYAKEALARFGVEPTEDAVEFGVGNPAAVILAAAERAATVVIATHGRGGFRAQFLGSVADKVVRGARGPVLAVPGTDPVTGFGGGPVLIALDGTPDAERALEAGRRLAAHLAREVVLVRAYSMPPPVGIEFAYYPADFAATLRQDATEYLAETARPGERTVVINSQPADAILRVADDVDAVLVAVASSGKSLPKRVALGSTTDRVLHALRRPLLIIPPLEDEA